MYDAEDDAGDAGHAYGQAQDALDGGGVLAVVVAEMEGFHFNG